MGKRRCLSVARDCEKVGLIRLDYLVERLFPYFHSARQTGSVMTDLVALLTFPSVSDGFSALYSTIHDNCTTLPSLPLSKVARLDSDSDSGSASRSRAGGHPTSRVAVAGGPVRVNLSGIPREWPYHCEPFQSAEFDHRHRATLYRTPN